MDALVALLDLHLLLVEHVLQLLDVEPPDLLEVLHRQAHHQLAIQLVDGLRLELHHLRVQKPKRSIKLGCLGPIFHPTSNVLSNSVFLFT